MVSSYKKQSNDFYLEMGTMMGTKALNRLSESEAF